MRGSREQKGKQRQHRERERERRVVESMTYAGLENERKPCDREQREGARENEGMIEQWGAKAVGNHRHMGYHQPREVPSVRD